MFVPLQVALAARMTPTTILFAVLVIRAVATPAPVQAANAATTMALSILCRPRQLAPTVPVSTASTGMDITSSAGRSPRAVETYALVLEAHVVPTSMATITLVQQETDAVEMCAAHIDAAFFRLQDALVIENLLRDCSQVFDALRCHQY